MQNGNSHQKEMETFTPSSSVKGELVHHSSKMHEGIGSGVIGHHCERFEVHLHESPKNGVGFNVSRAVYRRDFGSYEWKEAQRNPEATMQTLDGAKSVVRREYSEYEFATGRGAHKNILRAHQFSGMDELITAAMLHREQKQLNGYEATR
jgi:hypothetical protein